MNKKEYLGDAVYIEYVGYMLKLYTMEGDVIYLEPEVYERLKVFAEKVFYK